MAKDAKSEAASMETVEAAPPRKSKKLIILLVAAVFVLACVAGAGFFLLRSKAHADGDDGEDAVETAKVSKKQGKDAAPVYVPLETFTVNLVPENGDQFLQLMISVEVSDAHVGERMKMFTPKLRNNIMMLLSGKRASELISKEGKQTLANEVRELINEVLDGGDKKGADAPVREVLFTSFIIQ